MPDGAADRSSAAGALRGATGVCAETVPLGGSGTGDTAVAGAALSGAEAAAFAALAGLVPVQSLSTGGDSGIVASDLNKFAGIDRQIGGAPDEPGLSFKHDNARRLAAVADFDVVGARLQ